MPARSIPRRSRLATAVAAALTATVLAAGVLYFNRSNAAPAAAAPPATPVMVATVVQSDVSTWDEFSGRLEAVERVDVRSRVAGAVQSIHFNEGALVKAGDLLVTIDPAPYAAEVERAQAQGVAAQARLDNAKSELDRAQRLWDESAIARSELEERVNARRGAEANVRAADTALSGEAAHQGHLQLVDNQVNARSGTVRVRAVFDNAGGTLMPGQFAQIRLGRASPTSAILINERAVGTDQSKKFVLVVGDDNKAAYREVSLGAPVDGLRIVTSGLKANERIVVNGLQRVRPGSLVDPQQTKMASL